MGDQSKVWHGQEGCDCLAYGQLRQQLADCQNELADTLDLKCGTGPTALSMVVAERDSLRQQLAQYQAALKAKDSFLHWLNGKAGDPPMTLREALAIQPDDTAMKEGE